MISDSEKRKDGATQLSDDAVPHEAVPYANLPSPEKKQRLTELATVFFRLGTVAFGGPAAHIAMMDDEIVKRRRWMSRESLLDLMGVTNLLPGPNSTELAIHIGYERAGWAGLFVAGSCFIFPALVLVWLLAAVYVRYQTVPEVGWLLYGIKPVIIAVVLKALWKLGKKAAKDRVTTAVGVGAIAAYFAGLNEILMLLLAGLLVMLVKNWLSRGDHLGAFLLPLSGSFAGSLFSRRPVSGSLAQAGGAAVGAASATASVGWLSVFLFFLKVGAVLYGSGYVLLAFLQRDLVEHHQWLTSQELLDAVAIGQITPGPVLTTATFVGYIVAGHAGAIAGTVGIFLPAFLLVGLVNPWVPKLRRSPWAGAFLDGVNAASLGLMAGVTYILARAAVVDWPTLVLAGLSAIAVFRLKLNPAWLVLAGAVAGFVVQTVL
ncbi:MAG: chromate efflux transporter [Cyanobacteria bacterium J06554_11]